MSELTSFTSDLRIIDHGIDRIRMGSATALYDALFLGSQALEPRVGRKVMVVITDGGDTMSKVDYQEAVRAAETLRQFCTASSWCRSRPAPDETLAGNMRDPALSRHRGQIFLRIIVVAARRGFSPDQR